jgi:hypothetical protein
MAGTTRGQAGQSEIGSSTGSVSLASEGRKIPSNDSYHTK